MQQQKTAQFSNHNLRKKNEKAINFFFLNLAFLN